MKKRSKTHKEEQVTGVFYSISSFSTKLTQKSMNDWSDSTCVYTSSKNYTIDSDINKRLLSKS